MGATSCGTMPYFNVKILDFPRATARDYDMVNRKTLEFKFKQRSPIQSADGYICVSPEDWNTIRESFVGGK